MLLLLLSFLLLLFLLLLLMMLLCEKRMKEREISKRVTRNYIMLSVTFFPENCLNDGCDSNVKALLFFFYNKKMLEKFPKEILLDAFSLLTLQDKFQCLFICKNWYAFVMFDLGLHQKLSFLQSSKQLEDAFALFKANPNIGKTVIDLKMEQDSFDFEFVMPLPKILPNLKNLELVALFGWAHVRLPFSYKWSCSFKRIQGLGQARKHQRLDSHPIIPIYAGFCNLLKSHKDYSPV